MKFCTRCGFKMEDGDNFCRGCGALSTAGSSNCDQESGNKIHNNFNYDDETPEGKTPPFKEEQNNRPEVKRIPAKSSRSKFAIIVVISLLLLLGGGFLVRYSVTRAEIKSAINLGNKYVQDGNYKEAILAFSKVIEIEPKNIEARVSMAKAYIKLSQPDDAIKVLEEAVGISPKKVEPYLELANIYYDSEKLNDLLDILGAAYTNTRDSKIEELLLLFGNDFFNKEKYQEAVTLLNKGMEMDGKNIRLKLLLSKVFDDQEKFDEAEKMLEDILAIDIKNVEAYLDLGNLYAKLARLDDAIAILQQGYKETGDSKIKELLDELLQERSNGGFISDKVGSRIMDEYRNAKTYHYKGTVTSVVGENESNEELEVWIADNKLRVDYHKGGNLDRTLLVRDNKAIFFRYKDKQKSIAVVDASYYFTLYIMPDNAELTGEDEAEKALIYNVDINKMYDVEGATNKYYIRNINYYVSRRGIIHIKSYSGSDHTDIKESDRVFTNIEYNKEIGNQIFNDPF